MPDKPTYTLEEANHYFAINFNNNIWRLLEKNGGTEDENNELINLAHASLLHWSRSPACKKVNLQRGEYMIAIAYIHAGRKEPALYYAKRCQEMTAENKEESKDFDFAYVSLVMARALNLNGNKEDAEKYLQEARELGETINNKEDKRIFIDDLQSAMASWR
jgi:hypothetical protein